MTTEERLARLVANGCIITTWAGYMKYTVAVAVLRPDSTLYWASMFAEDQHHTHIQQYDEVRGVEERDLAFLKDGKLVAYIMPYTHSMGINEARYLDERRRWERYLADDHNREEWERFVKGTQEIQI